MDFFEKYMKETLEAIRTFKNGYINVKRIRIASNIKSSDRSKINFIWRGLKSLAAIDFLELNGSKSHKIYKLKYPEVPIDIEKIVSQVNEERKKR